MNNFITMRQISCPVAALFAGGSGYFAQNKILPNSNGSANASWCYSGYGMNMRQGWNDSGSVSPIKETMVRRPSQYVRICDTAKYKDSGDLTTCCWVGNNCTGLNTFAYPWHSGQCNVLWFDGHVTSVHGASETELYDGPLPTATSSEHANSVWFAY